MNTVESPVLAICPSELELDALLKRLNLANTRRKWTEIARSGVVGIARGAKAL